MDESMDLDQWYRQQHLPSKNGGEIIRSFVTLKLNIKRYCGNAEKYL
jgi:hypothetical protein